MSDFVFTAASRGALIVASQVCAEFCPPFANPDLSDNPGQIVRQGVIPTGGSWVYNYVGTVYTAEGDALPGVWGRFRFNGDASPLPLLIYLLQVNEVTVYQFVSTDDPSTSFWSSDGVTPAPDYVSSIGVLA